MTVIRDILGDTSDISLEDRANDILYYENISTESLTSFFREFTARTIDLTGALVPSFAERSYKQSMRRSNIVRAKMREMTNIDLANITFIVPESFSGNMLIYTEDLITAYDSVVESTKSLLSSILFDIANNINVSYTGVVNPPTSFMKAKDLRMRREVFQKKISGQFGFKRSKSYSKVIDHFRSPTEVVDVYNRLSALERTLGKTSIDDVIKLTNQLHEELNVYINAVKSTKMDSKSARAFKELTESVYEAARDVEFIGYVQANALQLYRSIEDLGEKVNKYKK